MRRAGVLTASVLVLLLALALIRHATAAATRPSAASSVGVHAWVLPGIDKLRPQGGVQPSAPTVAVAALGEHRGFQLAVQQPRAGGVTVELGAWRGPGSLGAPTVYHEATVPVSQPTQGHASSDAGLWPDPLAPVRPGSRVALGAGVGVFWIDVAVPRNARSGRYALPVRVRTPARRFTLLAHVDVVPARPSRALATFVGTTNENHADLRLVRLLHAFRFDAGAWADAPSSLRTLMRMQAVVELPRRGPPSSRPADMRHSMATLRSVGRASSNFAYVADEPGCSTLARVEQLARTALAADPQIRPLVTIGPAQCGGAAGRILRDVRIFVPEERHAQPVGADGPVQWIYPANGRAGPGHATLAIDDPGPASLLVPWRAAALNARGILYWASVIWKNGSDPFTTPLDRNVGQEYNGDGTLVYPGELPSLRLALFREGAEDYELAHCAGARGQAIAQSIAPSSDHLVESPARIMGARLAVARACASRTPADALSRAH